MVGGFEGDIATDTESLHYGHRSYVNGWKHAGLPYTYKVEKKYVYSPGEPCDCDEEHEKLDRKAIEK